MEDVAEVITKVVEDVCDKYCIFRSTADENGECEYMRMHDGACYLDELIKLIEED